MEHGGNHIVLVGFAGESACLSTMVDGFHRDHRIVYLKDASASHRLIDMDAGDVHDAVARIASLYGTVANTDSWIASETQRAESVL
jgi:nicotinamidase-related amidase